MPSQLPKRSTASLTVPTGFALSSARSDPGTPTGPGLKPVAEQVRDPNPNPNPDPNPNPIPNPNPNPNPNQELLAQGLSSTRYGERSAEQDKAERRRLVPYHMHINLELVEAVHLIAAMLLELPNLAHNSFDPKRRATAVSKTFRRLLDHFERQVFNGPPENIRDSVMATVQRLINGEWSAALESVDKLVRG